MIKFFRKIRQQLVTENKFSKYLIYAIGEIALVVIGILIALQLNNLNEIKKNKGYERDYLLRIKSDLNEDISELKSHFKFDTLQLDTYTFLGRYMNSNSIKTTPEILLNHIFITTRKTWFEGNNIVFDDMKSSGKTSLIESDTIRNKIQNYYRFFDEVIKQENMYNSKITRHFDIMYASIDTGPFIELGMQQRWKDNTRQININDLFNTLNKLEENEKNLFAENCSEIKLQILNAHNVRLSLYQKGIKLTKSIDDYLK